MKKLLALLLAATMMLSLVACTSNDTQVEDDQPAIGETQITDPETEIPNMNDLDGEQAVAPLPDDDFAENEVTPTITDDVAPDVTPEVETPAVTTPEVTTPEVTTPAPTTPEVTTPEATTPEVETPAATTLSAQSIYEILAAVNAEFPANMLVEGEYLTSIYPGLADASTDFVVYMPMMSAVAAEIAIAKTDGTSTVADIFQARIDYQVQGGAFYPETTEGWENNSHIVTVGDYVLLLACPPSDTAFAQELVDLFTTTVG